MTKNILLFIDWFLPGTKAGGPVRSMANLTDHLSDQFCFWIITRDTDYCETTPYPNVSSNTWVALKPNINVYYASSDQQNKKAFERVMEPLNIDCIYINGMYSPKFSIIPLQIARKRNKKVVVAPRGMLNPQAFSVKPLRKKLFIQAGKILGLYKNITFHATNDDEANYIRKEINANVPILVAPNLPRKIYKTVHHPINKEKGRVNIVNIARISPEKGTKHMITALTKVKTEGEVILDIYGPVYNKAYWEECENLIQTLPSNITVNYKGAVDGAKVPETLSNYHFFFMPSEGENFGHSILEAFSSGCPVLISDLTPWKNLANEMVGWDIPLKLMDRFSDKIEEMTSLDQSGYNEMSNNAFNLAIRFSSNKELLQQSKNIFNLY